jgi:phosphoglycerol transferase
MRPPSKNDFLNQILTTAHFSDTKIAAKRHRNYIVYQKITVSQRSTWRHEDMLLSELCPYPFSGFRGVYAWKAGRNTWWFIATLVVLGIFIVLNITLYASDYFTGDGINDAVLYTLTNSLTGAGVGKYILPGLGLVVALVPFWRAGLGAAPPSPSSSSSWLQPAGAFLALASVDASPAFHQITELVKSQSRDGDPDFVAYYKEPSKRSPTRSSTWSISTAKAWSAPILITMPSRT